MKYLYLIPHVVDRESPLPIERLAAGPWSRGIFEIEGLAGKLEWFATRSVPKRYVYTPGPNIEEGCAKAREAFGGKRDAVDWLLDSFARMDTEQVELLATTFAVWNDLLIDSRRASRAAIVRGVHGWHADKAKFDAVRIQECIRWLKGNGLTPNGKAPRTVRP